MKKLLLVSLLLGSFAFGQTIVTKKGSYCTGITSIGGEFVTLTAKNITMWLLDILGEEAIM